jgi:hypothetical protein
MIVRRIEKIEWKRGVKQWCSLSSLLFNLCLESLLQVVKKECRWYEFFVGTAKDRVGFIVQTYVNNVIFLSRKESEIGEMLEVLEWFVD